MKIVICGLIALAGLINFLPVMGVQSAGRLEALYGVAIDDPSLEVLMRHRAILFGLVGGFMIFAAFVPRLQWIAVVAGLVSMASFIFLTRIAGEGASLFPSIVRADLVGSALLVGAAALKFAFKA